MKKLKYWHSIKVSKAGSFWSQSCRLNLVFVELPIISPLFSCSWNRESVGYLTGQTACSVEIRSIERESVNCWIVLKIIIAIPKCVQIVLHMWINFIGYKMIVYIEALSFNCFEALNLIKWKMFLWNCRNMAIPKFNFY